MILIGLGANLPSPKYGPPQATCEAALQALSSAGVVILCRSRWYGSAPVPVSDQPWFVNGVIEVKTDLSAAALLALLKKIEVDLGRRVGEINAARVIDLDILAYGRQISPGGVSSGVEGPVLPHPRLAERAFVVLPLAEIAPGWRHPETGATAEAMAKSLPSGQIAEPLYRI